MNAGWYEGWVAMHCEATAAGDAVIAALLSDAVRAVLLDHARATSAELGEVTVRLLARGEKLYPDDHARAVGRELNEFRVERSRVNVSYRPGDDPPDCPACGGSGFAVVPLRKCVWEGRLVLHPDCGRVVTGAVLCDRPGCGAGRVARQKEQVLAPERRRATLSRCERAAGCDLVALIRDHERGRAAAARGAGGRGELGLLMDRVTARVRAAGGG